LRWIPGKDRIVLASLFIQLNTIWNNVIDEETGAILRSELQWTDMSDANASTESDEAKLNG
jgi:hypothetical protein